MGAVLASGARAESPPQHRALLIGVSKYEAFCPTHTQCTHNNLEGPTYDVAAMRSVLQRRYGFTPAEITVLEDAGARKPAVLAALQELAAWAAPGREIFIYFSGHGTGPLAPGAHLNLPDDTAALVLAPPGPVPAGMSSGSFFTEKMLLVGRKDVRPLLEAMDRKGASVVAVLDACFSQNAFRSATAVTDRRFRSEDLDSVFPPVDTHDLKTSGPWPYHNVAWISAASASEPAIDVTEANLNEWPTIDGKPHGALTDALLRVLDGKEGYRDADGRGALTYAELFDAAESYMRRMKFPQTPQVSPSPLSSDPQAAAVTKQPVFGLQASRPTQNGNADSRTGGLTVSVPAIGGDLRRQLAGIPDVELTDDRDAEYRIEAAGSSLLFKTARGESILKTDSDAPQPQSAATVIESLRLRAAMRRLAREANTRSQGLDIAAGSADPNVGGTLLPGQSFSLVLRASRDVTVALVDIMGDGSTRVWLPAIPGERTCSVSPRATAHVRTQLCAWPGSTPPFGLDLVYILAAEGDAPALAGIRDRELNSSVLQVFEDVVAHHRGRVAMLELPLYTLNRTGP
jgi:hypothetical protein